MKKPRVVCVQGLGFVGAAMAVAVADARDATGTRLFKVIGVDLPTTEGRKKIAAINQGVLPFQCEDTKLATALREAHLAGNLTATADPEVFRSADIVLININLDVGFKGGEPFLMLDGFREAVALLGRLLPPGALVIVESTVPPGTCELVAAPLLAEACRQRGLPEGSFLLAHSYERVMPGQDYLDSIVNFWRVFAGHTPEAADACENFLTQIINVQKYPLTRLSSTIASETGKVLENSYRAATIAFMEEWGRFAESIGINLFEVVEAIRKRPTHCNMRQPGFGVGGYCLTKDPLLPGLAARELFGLTNIQFPFCVQAVTLNKAMPLVSLEKIKVLLNGSLQGKSILLLGVSYRQDLGDTRHSPAQTFVEHARALGCRVICHDPYINYWPELGEKMHPDLPSPVGVDAVVLAVPHKQYLQMDLDEWLQGSKPLIFDANNVLMEERFRSLKKAGYRVAGIGRGDFS